MIIVKLRVTIVKLRVTPHAAADGSLQRAPELCVNKLGHGLHEKERVFERLFATPWVLQLLQQLGQREPAITQSMYIIKPPFIGNPPPPPTHHQAPHSSPHPPPPRR